VFCCGGLGGRVPLFFFCCGVFFVKKNKKGGGGGGGSGRSRVEMYPIFHNECRYCTVPTDRVVKALVDFLPSSFIETFPSSLSSKCKSHRPRRTREE